MFLIAFLTLSAQGRNFSNASLQGSYSHLTRRSTADPTEVQMARVGIITFDGVGNVNNTFVEVINGIIMTSTLSGTYTVNSDGSGSITWSNSSFPLLFDLNSMAGNVAHGFQYFVDIPANNESNVGTALMQFPTTASYSLSTLKGSFSFAFDEATLDSTVAIQGGSGLFTFDGKGNVKGSSSGMAGGVLQTGIFTGTYVVNPDGSGSISLSNNAQYAFVLNSVSGIHAKGLQLIQTNTTGDVAIGGTAQKQ